MLLMVIQSLPQCVFQQFIQADPVFSSSKMRSVSVKHITSAKAPEGVSFFVLSDLFHDQIIDTFCRFIVKCFIIQQPIRRHSADLHFVQPVVDDVVAGDVPQKEVTPIAPFLVLQSGMEIFMRENKNPLFLRKSARRIGINDSLLCVNRGNVDFIPMAQFNVLHNFKCSRKTSE